ncbi:MAG TPA: hypothetical protein VHQ65_02345 [Thermoanaerobaculia bacterium]|nr:hypothetical protein [Thermoanaerobaculia bacterium]
MRLLAPVLLLASLAATAWPAAAQPRITLTPPACIPFEEHSQVEATVAGEPGGSEVRLYFRRMHPVVEDFYWVRMNAAGGGRYWAVLPKPADEELPRIHLDEPANEAERRDPWGAWWMAKDRSTDRDPNDELNDEWIEERARRGGEPQPRDWMRAQTPAQLETWLEDRDNEPAEIYAAVFDANGRMVPGSRTPMQAVPVAEDCDVHLPRDLRSRGQAENLVIGETAPWQIGRPVFHWLCDGIVSRVDHRSILRADEQCRACIVAQLRPALLLGSVLMLPPTNEDDPEPVSPVEP